MSDQKNFIRVKEDFRCENCGYKVKGDGYTDHCPLCLWGKHVDDKIPGDRASDCGGMMEPMAAVWVKGDIKIEYRCQKCNHRFTVKRAKDDKIEELISKAMV
jgi:rubrerythrin